MMERSSSPWDYEPPPPPPQRPKIWTPWFIVFFALVVLLGIAAFVLTSLGAIAQAQVRGFSLLLLSYTTPPLLALQGALLITCLIGLRLVRNKLLRVGFALQVAAIAGNILIRIPPLIYVTSWLLPDLVFSPSFIFGPSLLGVLIQISLSYGLARWQPSDKVLFWAPVLLTLGVGLVNLVKLQPHLYGGDIYSFLRTTLTPFLAVAGVVCPLLRPACWKVSPLIVLCLTLQNVTILLHEEVEYYFLTFAQETQTGYVYIYALFGSSTLFILGLLLLIQRERRQEQMQPTASWQRQVGNV